MSLRWLPNAITGLRAVLALPLPWLVMQGHYRLALLLMLAAGLSDALDGFLAKHYGWESRLGALLDPMADKLVLVAAMSGLWLAHAMPGWLLGLVLIRDLVIVLGSLLWWRLLGPFTPQPSYAGKLTTFAQILLVLALLVDRAGWPLALELRQGFMLGTAAFTLWSGLDYVIRHGHRAWRQLRSAA